MSKSAENSGLFEHLFNPSKDTRRHLGALALIGLGIYVLVTV